MAGARVPAPWLSARPEVTHASWREMARASCPSDPWLADLAGEGRPWSVPGAKIWCLKLNMGSRDSS